MIRSLSINNIALIDSLDIDFHHGLTVLSGETGSGKSIIIDSLSFVLGERADKSLIKHGEEVAQVTALFELTEGNVTNKLAEYGFVDDYAYCAAYVRTYRGSKGKKLIERDLKLKGIDFNLVEKALSEEIDSQEDAVKTIAIKYMRGKEPTKENSAKLYKYILSKGFGYDEAAYAVKVVKGELWNEY